MVFSLNPRKFFACAGVAFLALNVLFASITLEQFVASAPESMRRFMRLYGYISALLTAISTIVVYVLAGVFTWSAGILAEVKLSQASLVRAVACLGGLACIFEVVGFLLADAYLFPRVEQLAFAGAEKFARFVEEGIRQTTWQTWRSRLDVAFLATGPVTFGIGIAQSEDEAAWAKGLMGGACVAIVLVVVVTVGVALQ